MIRFTDTDGVEIDGWVLEPVGFDPQKELSGNSGYSWWSKRPFTELCSITKMQYWAKLRLLCILLQSNAAETEEETALQTSADV